MEPMNLGSPPSSPANPNYLPAFLMGDSQPASPNPAISPSRNKTPAMIKPQQTFSQNPTNLRQKLFNQSINEYSTIQSGFNSPQAEKGPPKQGLFDTFESKPKSPIINSTMQNFNEQPSFINDSFSVINNDSLNYSCNLNDSKLPFQNCFRNDRINTLWVTVFGFQPSTTSLVLTQLANCGTIAEKKYPAQGNWMHIKFTSPHEVAKALLLNGKMVSNCTMIGVVLFHNKQEVNKENVDGHFQSPVRARPMRSSISRNQSFNAVTSPTNVPQKSTGIVTKAMEYVFGW